MHVLHVACINVCHACQVLDEAAAVAALETVRYRQEMEDNTAVAKKVVEDYVAAAQRAGVAAGRVASAVLQPEGSSDIGAALCRYAKVRVALKHVLVFGPCAISGWLSSSAMPCLRPHVPVCRMGRCLLAVWKLCVYGISKYMHA